MNQEDYDLVCLIEECNELALECNALAQRACKALRFGLDEIQPEQDKTNRERMEDELSDIVIRSQRFGLILKSPSKEKGAKFANALDLSRILGRLEGAK